VFGNKVQSKEIGGLRKLHNTASPNWYIHQILLQCSNQMGEKGGARNTMGEMRNANKI
jgi:hypothetical protein